MQTTEHKPIVPRSAVALAARQMTGAGIQNGQRKRKDPRAIRRQGKQQARSDW